MKTLRRFLHVVCLAAVLVLAQSKAYAAIIEEIMDFSIYPNLPVSLSGWVDADYGSPFDLITARTQAGIDTQVMICSPSAPRLGRYVYAIRDADFRLEPIKPMGYSMGYLIGFGLSSLVRDGWENPISDFEYFSRPETAGPSWSWSDVPPALLDVPTVFADPGSYITSFESVSHNHDTDAQYMINEIELFWYVPEANLPDGGNVLLPFLLTLILLLAGHQLSRVQGLRGHGGQ